MYCNAWILAKMISAYPDQGCWQAQAYEIDIYLFSLWVMHIWVI